jgi:hypothetical protein
VKPTPRTALLGPLHMPLFHELTLPILQPTSGLDAESVLQVMEFLKEYVRASPGQRVS